MGVGDGVWVGVGGAKVGVGLLGMAVGEGGGNVVGVGVGERQAARKMIVRVNNRQVVQGL